MQTDEVEATEDEETDGPKKPLRIDIRRILPAVRMLHAAGMTEEMWGLIGQEDDEYAQIVVKALRERMRMGISDEIITVPADLTGRRLLQETVDALRKMSITLLYSRREEIISLLDRELYLVRGKRLRSFRFGVKLGTSYLSTLRETQTKTESDGNAAAYLVWLQKTTCCAATTVSVPNQDARMVEDANGDLFVLGTVPTWDETLKLRFWRPDLECIGRTVGVSFKEV